MSGVRLLAFDTATQAMAVALRGPRGDRTVDAAGGAQASATLLPCIRDLLAAAGLAFADLDAIAFGCGPGAFTGLRASCSVAQGLGYALGRPLLPLDSLLVVAEDAIVDDGDAVVAMDARMDEIYAARYRRAAGCWRVVAPPALLALDRVAALWRDDAPAVVAGSALAAFGERLALPPAVRCAPDETSRAAALLRLAQAAWDAGAAVAPAAALPLYLRDKVAQTTAERAAAAAAR